MASAWLEKLAISKVVEIPVAMLNDFRNFVAISKYPCTD